MVQNFVKRVFVPTFEMGGSPKLLYVARRTPILPSCLVLSMFITNVLKFCIFGMAGESIRLEEKNIIRNRVIFLFTR
jgi:hypothetical protein